ncbi:hypothetical protein IJ135_02665 [Candidatus Saccharibacteria bacterium]|nr:hypothetical protein [Candidatus Saccharibacteria bacterium]
MTEVTKKRNKNSARRRAKVANAKNRRSVNIEAKKSEATSVKVSNEKKSSTLEKIIPVAEEKKSSEPEVIIPKITTLAEARNLGVAKDEPAQKSEDAKKLEKCEKKEAKIKVNVAAESDCEDKTSAERKATSEETTRSAAKVRHNIIVEEKQDEPCTKTEKSPAAVAKRKRIEVKEEKIEAKAQKARPQQVRSRISRFGVDDDTTRLEQVVETFRQDSEHLNQIIEQKEEPKPRVIATRRANTRKHTKISGKAMKEAAIERAIQAAASMPRRHSEGLERTRFGIKRVLLALACAAAAVFAVVYFVNINTPNITLKVAAMQSGIDAKYPDYVPRDFNLSDITSENGKITLVFENSGTGDRFSIIEERSNWDSSALLSGYVRETYGNDYTEVKEQGLTLFISNSDEAWVNGGVVYKLTMLKGSLTKKQLKAIAVSL